MIIIWSSYGMIMSYHIMIISWSYHYHIMIISYHDHIMIISWSYHDHIMIISWPWYDHENYDLMIISWSYHDHIMIVLLVNNRDSLLSLRATNIGEKRNGEKRHQNTHKFYWHIQCSSSTIAMLRCTQYVAAAQSSAPPSRSECSIRDTGSDW